MFLKVYQKVVAVIIAANLGFTEVLMYKGELEEGAEFRAVMPICYVEFADDNVLEYIAGEEAGETMNQLELYVCAKDTEEPTILDKVNSVIDLFDGIDIKVDGETLKARYIRTSLHAYLPGVGKAYKIIIGLH